LLLGWLRPCQECRKLSSLTLPANPTVITEPVGQEWSTRQSSIIGHRSSLGFPGACHHFRPFPLPGWSRQYSTVLSRPTRHQKRLIKSVLAGVATDDCRVGRVTTVSVWQVASNLGLYHWSANTQGTNTVQIPSSSDRDKRLVPVNSRPSILPSHLFVCQVRERSPIVSSQFPALLLSAIRPSLVLGWGLRSRIGRWSGHSSNKITVKVFHLLKIKDRRH